MTTADPSLVTEGNTMNDPRNARIATQGPRAAQPRPSRPRHARGVLAALATLVLLGAGAVTAQRVTLLTHESFALPEALVEAFETDSGIDLEVVTGGDAGEMVNRALLTRGRPIADVLFGIDDALIEREGARELFEPYRAAGLDTVPEGLRFADDLLTPITVGYVLFNLDPAAFEARGVPLPEDLRDLVEAPYEGLTVVPDPATSSPGLAFLLTTVAAFGEGGEYDWLDYWADLRDADVRVVSGWSDAYYTSFTRYGGDRPAVLSYATSPAAEVMFAEGPVASAPTVNLLCGGCAWRQIEAAGVLAGSDEPEAARRVVDFLLSPDVQAAVPESMFVHPARAGTELPDAFGAYAPVPDGDQIGDLDRGRVEAEQARWLEQWTRVVRQDRDPDEVRGR